MQIYQFTFTLQKNTQIVKEKLDKVQVLLGVATCALAGGADKTLAAVQEALVETGLQGKVDFCQVGCVGRCSLEPLLEIRRPGEAPRMYVKVDADKARQIVRKDLVDGQPINEWTIDEGQRPPFEPVEDARGKSIINRFTREWPHLDFFNRQIRVTLRNVGRIDPENLDDYLAVGGYAALAKVLDEMTPEQVIDPPSILPDATSLGCKVRLAGKRQAAPLIILAELFQWNSNVS